MPAAPLPLYYIHSLSPPPKKVYGSLSGIIYTLFIDFPINETYHCFNYKLPSPRRAWLLIRKLIVYIGEFKKNALLSPLLVTIETVCELFLPLFMADIIDVGINGGGGMPVILRCGVWMLALSCLSMYCGVAAAKHAAVASQGFGRNLRSSLFRQIQQFSFADIDHFSSASLITRITNDVNTLQMTVGMAVRLLVRAPVQLFSALAVCLLINARLTLILAAAIPVLIGSAGLLMKICQRLFRIFQEKIDGLNNAVQENLIAIRVVKAFVRGNYERKKFSSASDQLQKAGLDAVMRLILLFPVMTIILNVAILLVFWFGGRQVASGTMLTGDLFSFYSYIAQVLISVLMVAFCLLQMTRASACGKRILEVLETQPDISDRPDAGGIKLPNAEGRVEFENVSFRYGAGSGDYVLKDISFQVMPGEFVAIVGATGTGKSSLVNLIPRFYDVCKGRVLVDSMDVRDYPISELRRRIGMVLQKNVLFSGTIRENLLWGDTNASEEDMIQAAKDAQAHDFILSFPDGYDTKLEQGGVNVSGGQKQRLCIARAMLRKPSILILDDSTSAVDSATEAEIRRSFHENLKDTTVIIIAQRISSVRWADKILVLEDDHIAAMGTHEELMAQCSIYQEIYQSQQEGVMDNG